MLKEEEVQEEQKQRNFDFKNFLMRDRNCILTVIIGSYNNNGGVY